MQKLNSGALDRILLFVYILSLSTNAIAQNKNNSKETYLLPPHGNYVYGRVIEKLSKEPMVGVTIRLDGHSTGVITDINGCYVLTLPEKGGLVIYSYIGFETRKIKVTSRQKVDVQMVEATESIQEVIVTGYNSIQKESFTGNTTTDRERRPVKSQPEQPDFGHSDFRSLFQNTGESGCWFRSQQPASIRLAWSDRYRRNDTWADLHLPPFRGKC